MMQHSRVSTIVTTERSMEDCNVCGEWQDHSGKTILARPFWQDHSGKTILARPFCVKKQPDSVQLFPLVN